MITLSPEEHPQAIRF